MPKTVSVIDIGSNSARMAIFARTSRFGFYLLEEKKSRVRISEGSYENQGYLQEEPIRRTLNALNGFVQIAKARGCHKILCVATSALRDAPNKKDFLKRAKEECGLQIRIINGEQEAYYGALACANLLHQTEGVSIDVGGGSSEYAILKNGKIQDLFSLDIGAIRLKELFFDKGDNLEGAQKFIAQALSSLPSQLKSDCVFGIGGSIRAITKIILKDSKTQFFHGMEIQAQAYIAFCQKIISSSSDMLRKLGFGEDRIDSIRSGALIFATFLEHLNAKTVITSGVGVREGVFLENLLRGHHNRFPSNFNPSLRCLLDRFDSKKSKSKLIKKEALRIFDTFSPIHQNDFFLKKILAIASSLACIGESIGSHMQCFHSGYLAFYGLEYGYSFEERNLIRIILEHSSKKLPKENKSDLIPLSNLRLLISILTLSKFLTITPSILTYQLLDEETLFIGGASYLAQEQILKSAKILDFKVRFQEAKMDKYHHRVYI
ncbi:Ppx/GppA phosphatase family protein [Helicobacter kayseriensis]|uniref:Ppx/GppA phosphatase family protein n=1 Tax=Helicobacter kayseriensis TaxID=2905877 RepID=UPI001E4E359D|nr:Ppx/GppA phosphatase family protein [Helicobacter kayseriensis]MCE3047019.1 Ppx/GppA family phosphatase [Helicobacter kayseriensis]MCE3048321.1 Ppx/GppA family phosphatase [Helicobacter kayseriensis]